MPMTWNAATDAKLLSSILTHLNIKLSQDDYATLAGIMGPQCTPKAIRMRLAKIKAGGGASTATDDGSFGGSRGKTVKRATAVAGKGGKAGGGGGGKKKLREVDVDEEEFESGGDDDLDGEGTIEKDSDGQSDGESGEPKQKKIKLEPEDMEFI